TNLALTGAGLSVDSAVETTNLNAATITAPAVNIQSPLSVIQANVGIDTSGSNGAITFGGAVNDSTANMHTLNLTAGGGTVTLSGAVGATPLKGFTITGADTASLQAA